MFCEPEKAPQHEAESLLTFCLISREAGSYDIDLDTMKEVFSSLDISCKFSSHPGVYR